MISEEQTVVSKVLPELYIYINIHKYKKPSSSECRWSFQRETTNRADFIPKLLPNAVSPVCQARLSFSCKVLTAAFPSLIKSPRHKRRRIKDTSVLAAEIAISSLAMHHRGLPRHLLTEKDEEAAPPFLFLDTS